MPSFPPVTLLDNFNRSEEPLNNGGKWVKLSDEGTSSVELGIADGTHYISNVGFINHTTEVNACWTVKKYTEPGVAFEAIQFGGLGRYQHIWANLTISGTEVVSGWKLICEGTESSSRTLKLFEYASKKGTLIHEEKAALVAIGDKYGLSFDSNKVRAWHKKGAEAWEEKFNAADGGFKKGWIGIGANGTSPQGDNFEAGEVEPPLSIVNPGTQNSRVLKNVSLQIKATSATSYGSSGLPEGLSIGGTGLITGLPAKEEEAVCKVTAENAKLEKAETLFEWIVTNAGEDILSMLVF